MTTEEKLARLKNRSTRYEIVLTNGTGTKFLVVYTAQHSYRGLVAAIRQRYDAILARTGGELPNAAKPGRSIRRQRVALLLLRPHPTRRNHRG